MSNHDPLTLKLSLREKCAYGVGDFGSNLMLCIGTLYLLKFYTDELGMPAYYGGIIFLVAKFFTAFTDMLTGVLLDSRRNIAQKESFGLLFCMRHFRSLWLLLRNSLPLTLLYPLKQPSRRCCLCCSVCSTA